MGNDFYDPLKTYFDPLPGPYRSVPNIPRERCSTCPRRWVPRLLAGCIACRKLDECLPTMYKLIDYLHPIGRRVRCTIVEGEDLLKLTNWARWEQADFTKKGDTLYWEEFISVVDYLALVAEKYITNGGYSSEGEIAPRDMVELIDRTSFRPYR